MEAEDNCLLKIIQKLLGSSNSYLPEDIINGYVRFFTLNTSSQETFFKKYPNCKADAVVAEKWFADKGINLTKVKSYLGRIIPWIPSDVKRLDLSSLLESQKDSKSILEKVMECCCVPVLDLLTDKIDINDYIEELREKKVQKLQEDAKKDVVADAAKSSEEESAAATEECPKNNLEQLSSVYSNLTLKLLEKVKGQDRAVLKFVQGFNQGELFVNSEKRNRPRSYHFFFGPPGVGKTFLAETAAEALGIPTKIFNMSEYASNLDYEKLVGFDSSYKDSKDGELTEFVNKNKRCILIFDEIEKAHLNTIRLFLQILGAGSLDSVYTKKTVDFRDTIIVFTSNVGRKLYEDNSIVLSEIPEKVLIDAVKSEKASDSDKTVMPPEICSRIASGNVVVFNHLSVNYLVEIIDEKYKNFVELMKQEYDISVTYPKELPMLFLLSRGASIDARVATNKGEDFLKDEIYEFIRQYVKDQAEADVKRIDININWDNIDGELQNLFHADKKQGVMILADKESDFVAAIDSEKYDVYHVSTIEEAEDTIANDVSAILIDPYFGDKEVNEEVLSVSDYDTLGVKFFHDIKAKGINLPVYLLETKREFDDIDRRTFMLEGVQGTFTCYGDSLVGGKLSTFSRRFEETMTSLYMEQKVKNFTQRGWVVTYNTSQIVVDEKGTYSIEFYDLKKRMAVDNDDRGSILSEAERPREKFADIIGAEDAKKELQYFVQYLKNPRAFVAKKGSKRLPKGVLLYGPPGTGKTMLAKAMAGESDIMFLQATAAGFSNKYEGESEANIRNLFAKARRYAPAIIFIDEIDAIGKQRTGSDMTAHTEKMLNTLLTEMDGFSSNSLEKPVFVLAATNFGVGRSDDGMPSLDAALMRRFDNKIYVDLPNEAERKQYIEMMLAKKTDAKVSVATIQNIAQRTPGTSLAILQNVIELAERNANQQGRSITDGDLLNALEDYSYGQKREHSYEYYREVACHEVGHAYLSYLSGDLPSYITIESRGNFGGYMQHANQEDKPNYTKEELLARIRTSMGGRAAEKVFYGPEKSLNTGASSDLKQATDMAFKIVCGFGMDNSLVILDRAEVMRSSFASEYLQKVNSILLEQMQEAERIITRDKVIIEGIVTELLKKNYLTGEEFIDLVKK